MIWEAVLVVVECIVTLAKAPGFEAPGTHMEDHLINTSRKSGVPDGRRTMKMKKEKICPEL